MKLYVLIYFTRLYISLWFRA